MDTRWFRRTLTTDNWCVTFREEIVKTVSPSASSESRISLVSFRSWTLSSLVNAIARGFSNRAGSKDSNSWSKVAYSSSGGASEKPETSVGFVVQGVEVYIDLAGAVDLEKEKKRLQKEIDSVGPYVVSMEKKLSNKGFADNAPEDVLDGEKQKLESAREKLDKLKQQLSSLIS